ncbi:hypothetical protein H4R19_007173, partial [Coemansia spiralis]
LYRRGYEYAKEWTAEWQRAGLLAQWQPLTGNQTSGPRRVSPSDAPAAAFRLTRRNSI